MTDAGLRRTYRQRRRTGAGPSVDCSGLGSVVLWRGGAVGIHVSHLLGRDAGTGAGGSHCRPGCFTLRMRLGEMVNVCDRAVADDLTEDFRVASERVIEGFKRQNRRTFAERKPVPFGIAGP